MSKQTVEYWSEIKQIIDKVCSGYDDLWQKRNRVLNSKIILMMIFKIILGNRRQGLSINLTEFWEACSEKGIDLPQTKSVLKKQGYFLQAKPILFRFFKRNIKGETYIYGTTLSRHKVSVWRSTSYRQERNLAW